MAVNAHLIVKRIDLYKEFHLPRKKGYSGYLDLYIPAAGDINPLTRRHPFMLVIPGGAYAFVSCREGEPVLFHFLANGFYGGILNYSLKVPYPVSLLESMLAMKYIKKHADSLRLIPDKVAAVGFSAGGHLLGLLSTLTKQEKRLVKGLAYRPDASIFGYAVISGKHSIIQLDSFQNLFATDPQSLSALSVDKRVDANASPSFIWATKDDETVPFQNSVLLHDSLDKAGVDNKLLLLDNGPHGLSVSDLNVYTEKDLTPSIESDQVWLSQVDGWLKDRSFKIKD